MRRWAAGCALGSMLLCGACGGDGASDDTLDPLVGTPGDTSTGESTVAGPASTDVAAIDPAEAGSGFVSLSVQVASEGIDETLTLDRSSVRAADLDPLGLDATCSALDGGDVLTVSVIDLRRLAAGSQLVSATLRSAEPVAGPGEYEGFVELADVEQLTTTYGATIVVDDGASTGSFEGTDDSGNVASGTFTCSVEPVSTTTTTLLTDEGEEVPETSGP